MSHSENTNQGRWSSRAPNGPERISAIVFICLCAVGFLIVDVAAASNFREAIPALVILGVLAAQLTMICVWGTLVRGTFWIRLPWTLLLLVLSWCALAWGITLKLGRPNAAAMLLVGTFWMFGFVTSFVPLKIAALCFRWQIVQDSARHRSASQNSRYAIRDIMIGTMLLAAAMGLGRAMLPGDIGSALSSRVRNDLLEPEVWVPTSIFGIVSLLVKLPCIWIALAEKKEQIPSRIGIWAVYCFGLAAIEMAVLRAIIGPMGDNLGEVFGGIVLSHQLMGAIILVVCLALRGLGCRLERSSRTQVEQEVHAGSDAEPSISPAEPG